MDTEERMEVDVTCLLTAEVILPMQVVHPPADRWLRRLCLAIFEDALKCLGVSGVRRGREARARSRQEAWEWVLSDADYCFSFTTVCAVLNLNAEAVRRQLRQRFEGGALQAGVSRGLRQPLARSFSKVGAKNGGTAKTKEEARWAEPQKAGNDR